MFLKVITCEDIELVGLLNTVKNVMHIIQLVVPILLLLMASIELFQLLANPEKKNGNKPLINKFIAAIVVFFIPIIVNVTMALVGENTSISSCWTNASNFEIYQSGSYSNLEDDRKPILKSDSDYEAGIYDPNEDNNNQNSNNSNSNAITIFLGDSRTVQMYAYITGDWNGANYSSGGAHVVGNDVFIAQSGKGLEWMKNVGIPASQSYYSNNTNLVILMGVNDLSNVDNYINYVKSIASSVNSTGTRIYFDSVNPCDKQMSSWNSSINSFNNKIRNELSGIATYIDSNSYLMSNGFSTLNDNYPGLHYTRDTSNKIYNYIKNNT